MGVCVKENVLVVECITLKYTLESWVDQLTGQSHSLTASLHKCV